MATNWADTDVRCPFYQKSTAKEVHCEGIFPGTTVVNSFADPKNRKKLMEVLCYDCFTGCGLYRALEKKYET